MAATTFTHADLAYIRANYLTMDQLCAGRGDSPASVRRLIDAWLLPRPSYVLDDGSGMFPADYFRLVDDCGGAAALRDHFTGRYRAAAAAEGISDAALKEDSVAYLGGVYGICLREVTPETIVRKRVLVASLCQLLVLARPRSAEWRAALRAQVDELDTLERAFAPDYDRSEVQERPPTRDLLIAAARERFPDLFVKGADAEAV
ncbi:MAG: DUF6058 family natural product biosynthesis protein [Actinomycetota bacterium]|nr:DUF6058 family natural product biosynthesis protein [Actinomycetota bacterium]